jgi:hypothetical protein
VKRRQRVLKLCIWPRNHVTAGAFVLLGGGAASRGPLRRGLLDPAGSWSMAEVRDGLPGNLRSPVLSEQEKPEWGTPASKCPWPGRTASGLTGARERYANRERKARNWKRNHKRPVCSARWRSVSVVSAKSGNLIEGTRRREGRRHRRELLTGNMEGTLDSTNLYTKRNWRGTGLSVVSRPS